jgi:hypothetical protein
MRVSFFPAVSVTTRCQKVGAIPRSDSSENCPTKAIRACCGNGGHTGPVAENGVTTSVVAHAAKSNMGNRTIETCLNEIATD